MQGDLAMSGRKREREDPPGNSADGGSGGASKWGRGGVLGKRVFECTICGKACSSSTIVTTHMRTHTGDRPYACTTCGMTFSVAGTLKAHMRTHTGERLHEVQLPEDTLAHP